MLYYTMLCYAMLCYAIPCSLIGRHQARHCTCFSHVLLIVAHGGGKRRCRPHRCLVRRLSILNLRIWGFLFKTGIYLQGMESSKGKGPNILPQRVLAKRASARKVAACKEISGRCQALPAHHSFSKAPQGNRIRATGSKTPPVH